VAGSKFRNFDWATISAGTAPQLPFFQKPNIASLSQLSVLSAADQVLAQGQNLVNFIRGDRTNEGLTTETTKFYRVRKHLLGDIVNAEAVYVKSPLQAYTDTGFSAYATSKSARQGVVYAAANDGMLHAFNASNGAEMWSYIPELILPNLYKLADKNYSAQHRYFADGTPVSGDAYFGGAWHTIVVAGLNGGGRGYYAMDVTNPGSPPVTLWEYTNDNMGYTYGNPVITKLSNGQWVVLVTSGYNNVPDGTLKPDGTAYGGDGVGRLFVLDAGTGALIRTISTGAGTPTSPSGLARISAWVNNATTDNTALRAYGGDMLGNVWRFDINSSTAAHRLVTLYANAAGTVVQPITTRPELGDVSGTAMVYIGTGRFLGVTDLNDVTQQSFYGIKDRLDGSSYGNPKGGSANFVNQVLTNTTCPAGSPATICGLGQAVRTSTRKTVNLSSQDGWYVDLPDGVGAASGTGSERANTDPTLALGTLGFTTNIPNSSACTSGGYSYRYLLDYRTGAPVSTSTTGVSAIKLGNALSTRGVFVRLPNNTVVQLTRLSDGTTMTTNVPIGTAAGPTRRISWRELIQDQ
jgi:type IV pilus assembly protein PilY1